MSKKQEPPYQLKHYLNSINHQKNDLMDSEDVFWEKNYPTFAVNRCIGSHSDSLFYANEMNRLHFLDKKLQYNFLLNSISKRKRFAPWLRAKEVENIGHVKEYYGYSNDKAKQALNVLTDDQIRIIKSKLIRGGKHGTGMDDRPNVRGGVG
jgi:hypothetical protein|tara:strand:- start:1552 stop:2004 length:453 start_codon:yes stop_codon:yes gene_type:complete